MQSHILTPVPANGFDPVSVDHSVYKSHAWISLLGASVVSWLSPSELVPIQSYVCLTCGKGARLPRRKHKLSKLCTFEATHDNDF